MKYLRANIQLVLMRGGTMITDTRCPRGSCNLTSPFCSLDISGSVPGAPSTLPLPLGTTHRVLWEGRLRKGEPAGAQGGGLGSCLHVFMKPLQVHVLFLHLHLRPGLCASRGRKFIKKWLSALNSPGTMLWSDGSPAPQAPIPPFLPPPPPLPLSEGLTSSGLQPRSPIFRALSSPYPVRWL